MHRINALIGYTLTKFHTSCYMRCVEGREKGEDENQPI